MKINQSPNLRVEDYPTQAEWIGKFFTSINSFITNVTEVINGQIDFASNISTITKVYNVDGFVPFDLLWNFSSPPVSVSIVQAKGGTNLTATILLCSWTYNFSTKIISISRISEITPTGLVELDSKSGKYQFTLRASI